jgi:hypothetical protein
MNRREEKEKRPGRQLKKKLLRRKSRKDKQMKNLNLFTKKTESSGES